MQTEITNQFQNFWNSLVGIAPVFLKAIIFLIIGFWIVKKIDNWIKKYFEKKDFDVSLEAFMRSLINIGLKVLVLVTFAGIIGLPTTSMVAIFGAAGLAIGFALQGSLSNFAGGVLILIFKPYKIGDLITSQGETGVVTEIQIFNTILLTPDNKTVILPNGAVSNGTIINISKHGNLRVDLKVTVDFKEDTVKVRQVIMDVLSCDVNVLKDPVPSVNVLEYGESAIVLAVRPFATPEKYWDVYFNSYEKIRTALVENGINAPQLKRIVVQN
jgi:small conductance mechanosensitive channel